MDIRQSRNVRYRACIKGNETKATFKRGKVEGELLKEWECERNTYIDRIRECGWRDRRWETFTLHMVVRWPSTKSGVIGAVMT